MNCTTPTFMPWPMARATRPKPALDLPLPLPVFSGGRRAGLGRRAMAASTTAFFFAMRSLWRWSRSLSWVSSVIFNPE